MKNTVLGLVMVVCLCSGCATMDGKRQSTNLVLNGDFRQGLSFGWISKTVQTFPDPRDLPNEYKAPCDGAARIVLMDGLPTLEMFHEGRGSTRVFQDIPLDKLPTTFSGDFRFHLVDTWGHSSFLAFAELAFYDKAGNVLGRHVWHYGALRENWGVQTTVSSTSSRTDLRTSSSAFSELESGWVNCQLDLSKALRETLTGIDTSKVQSLRITMDSRSDAKKGFMKMWARNIEVNFGNGIFQHCTNLPPVIHPNKPAPSGAVQPPRAALPEVIRARPSPTLPFLTLGDYTYTTNAAGQATITGFKKNYTGALAITNTLGGCPVTSIGDAAFASCTSLTSVTIPASVTSIGNNAFDYCTSLTNVVIADGVTTIRDRAFMHCPKLISITIPDSVTAIGYQAFSNCTGLKNITIPPRLTDIGFQTFYACASLTNITIPKTVTSFPGNSTVGCSSLIAIGVDEANPAYRSSKDGVVFDKEMTCLVTYPGGKTGSYVIPGGVTSIGDSAFAGCTNLTGVTIPDSVTDIREWAFSGTSPASVVIPKSVTRIRDHAFHGCTRLTNVTISASVTGMGNWAFSGCTSLTDITIPASVTRIGDGAFSGCAGLTNITIPASVINFGVDAFQNCTNLPASIQNLAPKGPTRNSYTELRRQRLEARRKALQTRGTNPPLSGEALEKHLQQYEMYLIRAGGAMGPPLPIPLTPEMDAQLVKEGFLPPLENQGKESETSNQPAPSRAVQQPRSALPGVIRALSSPTLTVLTLGDYTYTTNAAGQATITGFNKNYTGALIITNNLGGCPVTRIGNSAFSFCTNLTSVTIPDGATSIGAAAFQGCMGMTNITIPASVTSFGFDAFQNCSNLPAAIQNLAPIRPRPAPVGPPGVIHAPRPSVRQQPAQPDKVVPKQIQESQTNSVQRGPPLPIPLTKEQDAQLVSEGFLPPQE